MDVEKKIDRFLSHCFELWVWCDWCVLGFEKNGEMSVVVNEIES